MSVITANLKLLFQKLDSDPNTNNQPDLFDILRKLMADVSKLEDDLQYSQIKVQEVTAGRESLEYVVDEIKGKIKDVKPIEEEKKRIARKEKRVNKIIEDYKEEVKMFDIHKFYIFKENNLLKELLSHSKAIKTEGMSSYVDWKDAPYTTDQNGNCTQGPPVGVVTTNSLADFHKPDLEAGPLNRMLSDRFKDLDKDDTIGDSGCPF